MAYLDYQANRACVSSLACEMSVIRKHARQMDQSPFCPRGQAPSASAA